MSENPPESDTRSNGPRVAVVTGASRGIGAHIATALSEAGWSVALLARSRDRLQVTADRLRERGARAVPVAVDVTDTAAVDGAVSRTAEELGPIGLLVNNAGLVENEQPLWESDVEQWWQMMTTNVRGPYLMTRAVVPGMIAAGGGRIINLNSGAATRASADLTGYAASKAALARITGGTHAAGWAHGIRAFDLAPGVVRTGMSESMRMHADRTDWTDPRDVTDLVLALAGGGLDAWSGRLVRAGSDSVPVLRERGEQGLPDQARTIGLRPWGSDDPIG